MASMGAEATGAVGNSEARECIRHAAAWRGSAFVPQFRIMAPARPHRREAVDGPTKTKTNNSKPEKQENN